MEDIQSIDKKPSEELSRLIIAAAHDIVKLGELRDSIFEIGRNEGFTNNEIKELVRVEIKNAQIGLTKHQMYYLLNREKRLKSSKDYQQKNLNKTDSKKSPIGDRSQKLEDQHGSIPDDVIIPEDKYWKPAGDTPTTTPNDVQRKRVVNVMEITEKNEARINFKEFIKSAQVCIDSGQPVGWVVIDEKTRKVVGMNGYHPDPDEYIREEDW